MSVEGGQISLEGYLAMQWVLATTSRSMLAAFQSIHTDTSVINMPAPTEPLNGKSRNAATSKNNDVSSALLKENHDHRGVVLSADVAFIWNKKTQHRADRDGEPDQATLKRLQKEAKKRYAQSFEASWQVSFAAHVLHTGLRRLLTVKIPILSQTGIEKKNLKRGVDPSSNALVRLAELAKTQASFGIAHKDVDKVVPLDPDMAVMLVAAKMLPKTAMGALLTEETVVKRYVDHSGIVWDIPMLDVETDFPRPRE
jgi:hypothetical protein